jgi:hypothetical protein
MWFKTVDSSWVDDSERTEWSGGGPLLRGKLLLENRRFGLEARFDYAFTEWETRASIDNGPVEITKNNRDSISMGIGCHWWF